MSGRNEYATETSLDPASLFLPSRPQWWLPRALWGLRGHRRAVRHVNGLVDSRELEPAGKLIASQLKKFKGSPQLQLALAHLFFQQKRIKEACATLDVVLENKFSLVAQVFESAKLYSRMSRKGLAIKAYRRVVEMGPDNIAGASHHDLSVIFAARHEPENSLRHAVKAIECGYFIFRQTIQHLISNPPSHKTLEWAVSRLSSLQMEHPRSESSRLQTLSYCQIMLKDWTAATETTGKATKLVFEKTCPKRTWDDDTEPLRPRFLIIGAMKSGTTSLWKQLVTHPKVLPPQHKELQFFSFQNWPISYYRELFPRISTPGFVTGEASPGYYRFNVGEQIKSSLPDVKLIFIQRDPVQRALSHYFHNLNKGISAIPFSKVHSSGLEKIKDLYRLSDEELYVALYDVWNRKPQLNSYLLLSCYNLLLRPWRRLFQKDQLLTIEMDDYVENNETVIKRVEEFIGVEPGKCEPLKKSNAGRYHTDTPEFRHAEDNLSRFFEEIAELDRAYELG